LNIYDCQIERMLSARGENHIIFQGNQPPEIEYLLS
jgi:hypothetical protein